MANLLIVLVALLLFIYICRSVKSQKKIQKEIEFLKKQNELLELSRPLEAAMANSTITRGSKLHDVTCRIINYTKYQDSYMSFKLKLRLLIFRDDIAAKELAQEIKNDLSKLAPEARECYENVFSKYIELVTFKHFGFFVLLCFPHIVKIIISMLFSYSLDSVCDERLKQKAAILSVAKTYT